MTSIEIVSALQRYWALNGPADIATVFPGTVHDVSAESMWGEFWVTRIQEPLQRWTSPKAFQLSIDVHLFSQSSDPQAIYELADSAGQTLGSKVLTVTSVVDEQPIGTLRMYEPDLKDLSRPESVGQPQSSQHLLLTVGAVALDHLHSASAPA
ncbi:hypothetical protein KOR42_46080 [Thalassoglobus neptunius]|uniref:Uncharacterized protein n=1 Tax=Thalassoglobus neptunius TaxID=1938619 RepID=A0A5C5VW99_9PLAN|nr:hypothetical protein [Thalassoglobus neptunius]TWT42804.1 hypothetical protein KOR42_46080 [Thalassoglobus neptunius]